MKLSNSKFYETVESVYPPTKYLTNGMWIYMVPQFKPESILMLGYAAGTTAGLIRLLYGDDIPITAVDLEPCEATYGVNFVQADAKDYIKSCEKFDVIIVDLFDLGGNKIPDFVYEEWFVEELKKKANYVILDAWYEPKSDLTYYKKHLHSFGKNKPNKLVNHIWYFATDKKWADAKFNDLIIR